MPVTVQFSPAQRLARTRVALDVRVGGDPAAWAERCRAAVRAGAGLLVVGGTHDPGTWLSLGRARAGTALVGVAEPVPAGTLADVVVLTKRSHAVRWPGTLAGCTVRGCPDVVAAAAAGCTFVVADHHLAAAVAGCAPEGLVWFVSGCTTLADVRTAAAAGARRVWLPAGADTLVADCSAYLRGVWRDDPAFGGMALTRQGAWQ